MKAIKFSEKELDFLRTQYQMELEDANKYVEDVKNILNKLGVKPDAEMEPAEEKKPTRRGRPPKAKKEKPVKKGKRGRKPKVKIEQIIEEPKPESKPIKEKSTKKGKIPTSKKKVGPVEKTIPSTVEKPTSAAPKPPKPVSKKKSKKKTNRKKGIVLKNLSKPLPKMVEDKPAEIPEQTSETKE